jgi:NAD(P)-dependent dehydrogenase (short-subunit alcohol dehydrogenase family)
MPPNTFEIIHLRAGSAITNCGLVAGFEIDYAATTGAVYAFTKSLAQKLVDRRIRVNCVATGPTVQHPVSKPAEAVAEHGANSPTKRLNQPDEEIPVFVFRRECGLEHHSRGAGSPGRRNDGRLVPTPYRDLLGQVHDD